MIVRGYFGEKGLKKIIKYVERVQCKKEIDFYETPDYNKEDGFSTYQCLYPCSGFAEVEDFSKSEMLYLQEHGFIFKNEREEIVNVTTLND